MPVAQGEGSHLSVWYVPVAQGEGSHTCQMQYVPVAQGAGSCIVLCAVRASGTGRGLLHVSRSSRPVDSDRNNDLTWSSGPDLT